MMTPLNRSPEVATAEESNTTMLSIGSNRSSSTLSAL